MALASTGVRPMAPAAGTIQTSNQTAAPPPPPSPPVAAPADPIGDHRMAPPAAAVPPRYGESDAPSAPLPSPAAAALAAASLDTPVDAPLAAAFNPLIDSDGGAASNVPPSSRTTRGIWIVVILAGLIAAVALAVWTWNWTRTSGYAAVATTTDDPAPAVAAPVAAPYRDDFLSPDTVTMVTTRTITVQAIPSPDGTGGGDAPPPRRIDAGAQVSGRWVRGIDPATRWFRLADGGYVAESMLAEPGGAQSPISIPFSNANFAFGSDIDGYVAAARTRALAAMDDKQRANAADGTEDEAYYGPVPHRRWYGLTITGVASYYESGAILFAEDEATVRRALGAAGIRIDSEGAVVSSHPDEPTSCSVGDLAQDGRSSRFGQSQLICGI